MFYIRKAQQDDCNEIFELRNDPLVRAYSFTGDPISYESHLRWFESSLKNLDRKIYVVFENKSLLGVVRFDLSENCSRALVSIYISPNAWGKGVGSFALVEGERKLREEVQGVKIFIAKVFEQNVASKKMFLKCDYIPMVTEFIKKYD